MHISKQTNNTEKVHQSVLGFSSDPHIGLSPKDAEVEVVEVIISHDEQP